MHPKFTFIAILLFLSISGYAQDDDKLLKQKEFVLKMSYDSFQKFKPKTYEKDELKYNSHYPTEVTVLPDVNALKQEFITNLEADEIRNGAVPVFSRLKGFPNSEDIVFELKWKSVLDSTGAEVLDMDEKEMLKESKSASGYKPFINGAAGFKTDITLKTGAKTVIEIKGIITIKIPLSYQILEIGKKDKGVTKFSDSVSFMLMDFNENTYILESIGDSDKLKVMPLNADNKQYAGVSKKYLPLNLYEEFLKNPELTPEQLKSLAATFPIDKNKVLALTELSGNFSKILIYKVKKYHEISFPVLIKNQ